MRVLHVITRLINGGAQQNTVLSCAGQVAAGHEVHLAYGPIYGPEGSLLAEAQASGATLHELASMRRAVLPWADLLIVRELRQLIRDLKPDLVHTHSSKAGIVGRAAAWKEKVPAVVHTVHGLPFHSRQPRAVYRLYVALERWAAKRCHHLVAITPAMVEAFERARIAGPERFTVIPSGVDLSAFETVMPRAVAKVAAGLPGDAPVVGLIARLDPLKGHDDLLDAAARLIRGKHPTLRVLFVGDGFARPQVERAVAGSGIGEHVVMAGRWELARMAEAYRACDVVALPSWQEGQSRVLVEALWNGCGVVGYDVGGVGAVCVDGVTGRLVPLGDRAKLADALDGLLSDAALRERLVAQGRAHVHERFSAAAMNEALLALYARLA